jgi:nicotinate-nucleotide adenylyltransferase
VHNGHLIAAEEARHGFGLDEVVFMPTGAPWQKAHRQVTDAEDRYLMTVLATASNPGFVVSRHEVDRKGPTYAVDTLRAMTEQTHGTTELYFITGTDAILEILTWKAQEEVLSLATFIAATRPGYNLARLDELGERVLRRVQPLQIPALAISSSEIRERVAQGRPIRYLVPEAVAGYIHKRGLYRVAE